MTGAEILRLVITGVLSAIFTHGGFHLLPPPTKPVPKTAPVIPDDQEDAPAPKPKTKPKPKPQPMPKPQPQPEEDVDPLAAIGRITFGSAGCTANVISPRRADGRYDVLTASHCVKSVGQKGIMELRNGKRFGVTVVVFDRRSDCCWMVTDGTQGTLPVARLAVATPAVGSPVWHAGFGIDKPGNREDGVLRSESNTDGQIMFNLSVSPGDSGGAIVEASTGRVLSPVCCTSALGRPGQVWGASPESCQRIRPKASGVGEWVPVPLPTWSERPHLLPELVG